METERNVKLHKLSRAFNGDSILALPPDRLIVRRVYPTYDKKNFKPARAALPQNQQQPREQAKQGDDRVVIEALQRLLRGKEDKPQKSFSEFGQARPIR